MKKFTSASTSTATSRWAAEGRRKRRRRNIEHPTRHAPGILLRMKKVKYLIGILALWFIVHSSYVVADGLKDEEVTADVAVILGSKVNEDGSLSPRLDARIQKGFELYQAGKVKKLV